MKNSDYSRYASILFFFIGDDTVLTVSYRGEGEGERGGGGGGGSARFPNPFSPLLETPQNYQRYLAEFGSIEK